MIAALWYVLTRGSPSSDFNIMWAALGLFLLHINRRVSLLISTKRLVGILVGIESVDQVGINLTKSSLPIHEHGMSLHLFVFKKKCSSQFRSFPHIDIVRVLLVLY